MTDFSERGGERQPVFFEGVPCAAARLPDYVLCSVCVPGCCRCVMRQPAAGRASPLMLLLSLSAASAAASATAEGLLLVRPSCSGVRAARLASRGTTTTSRGTRSRAAFASPAAAAATAVAFNSRSSRGVLLAAASSPRPISRTPAMSSTAASPAAGTISLETLKFDNQAIRELPVDPIPDNYVRRVENACFSIVAPDPVEKPVLVAASNTALALLGLGASEGERDVAAEYFSGEILGRRAFGWFGGFGVERRYGLL